MSLNNNDINKHMSPIICIMKAMRLFANIVLVSCTYRKILFCPQSTKAFLPRMLELQNGHVVCLNSILSLSPIPGAIDYCTSKSSSLAFMESLTLGLLDCPGVSCTTVLPFHTNTEMFQGMRVRLANVSSKYHKSTWNKNFSLLWTTTMCRLFLLEKKTVNLKNIRFSGFLADTKHLRYNSRYRTYFL